ncbi:vWA domain-containing protein [Shewanella sp. OMA3-2]|uniref:vWA domain-containing protein n=1 Tax=Shewanella sp. OMA3-2 TaxID=2908650 RepID=UPI001F35666C|nr:von Willebrand factor type A domain-containing protein [Shewanella sp. OMA3-2]UJF21391.1 von Willebrand factor type A domain-containing protein [Shewanella sp. OMA3-2]
MTNFTPLWLLKNKQPQNQLSPNQTSQQIILGAKRSIGILLLSAIGFMGCQQKVELEPATRIIPEPIAAPEPIIAPEQVIAPLAGDEAASYSLAHASADASAHQTKSAWVKSTIRTHQTASEQYPIGSTANRTGAIDNFAAYAQNGNMVTAETPVSTFSIDVDTASYTTMRQQINRAILPLKNSVRVEELLNYFDYDYPIPNINEVPFSINTELAPSPYNQDAKLLRIGIQGFKLTADQIKAKNLVFLIDVSGSMSAADKLPLLQQALIMLTQSLTSQDRVSIVVYANGVHKVLDGAKGNNTKQIQQALNDLQASGGTNGGKGLALAYDLAHQHFIDQGINQVLLATDGDFNLGMTSQAELINYVSQQREKGIGLTTLGFGLGSQSAQFNDVLLEQLANQANGQYAYIDNLNEARKVLHDQLSQTLDIIASDVKIQVEFNPAIVSEYRLIGYENRQLQREDFNNDKVDAGEIGAGHNVTAIYELRYHDSDSLMHEPLRYKQKREPSSGEVPKPFTRNEIAFLKLRYKPFSGGKLAVNDSQLISQPIYADIEVKDIQQASDDFRFAAAVAGFGQLLNHNHYVHNTDYAKLIALAKTGLGEDNFGYRHEFVQLMRTAKLLVEQGVEQQEGFYDK